MLAPDQKFLLQHTDLLNHYKTKLLRNPNKDKILSIIGDNFDPSYFPHDLNEGYYKNLDTIDRMMHMKLEEYRILSKVMEIAPNDIILDFGSGFALLGMMYGKQVKKFYCFDTDEKIRTLVKTVDPDINYIKDISKYKFTKIFCRNVIGEYYHGKDAIDLFKKFFDILEPGGRIAFNFHTPQSPYFPHLGRHTVDFVKSNLLEIGYAELHLS